MKLFSNDEDSRVLDVANELDEDLKLDFTINKWGGESEFIFLDVESVEELYNHLGRILNK